jgi:hypothetical protein
MRPPTTGCRCCRGATYPHLLQLLRHPIGYSRQLPEICLAQRCVAAWSRCFLTRSRDARVGQMISRFFQMVLLSRPISSTISSLSYSGERAPGVKQPLPSHAGTLNSKPTSSLYMTMACGLPCRWLRLRCRQDQRKTSARAKPFVPLPSFHRVHCSEFPSPHSSQSSRDVRDDGSKRGIVGVFDPRVTGHWTAMSARAHMLSAPQGHVADHAEGTRTTAATASFTIAARLGGHGDLHNHRSMQSVVPR